MKVMMKVMGIKMPRMTMVNLYLKDLEDGLMVQKVWSSMCINILMIILNTKIIFITIIFRVIIIITIIIVVSPKVWLEECNWKEYPALSMVQVSPSLILPIFYHHGPSIMALIFYFM